MTQRYSRPYIQQPQGSILNTYHFTSSVTTEAVSLTAQRTHLMHLGVSPIQSTGCKIIVQCTLTGSNIQWGEVAIFSGFWPTQLPYTTVTATGNYLDMEPLPVLTRLGFANLGTTVLGSTAGAKIVDCAFTGTTCYYGDELWLAMGFSASVSPTFLSNVGDIWQSGKYLTVTGSSLGRPSLIGSVGGTVGVVTGLTWGLTTVGFPLAAVKLN